MVSLQAKSSAAQTLDAKAEDLVARIRNMFDWSDDPTEVPVNTPDQAPLESDPEADESVVPEPERGPLSTDPEVPEGDALEQAEEVTPGPRAGRPSRDPEAPAADAWEQSLEVPFDDDEPL
jgi:hypothetical protein